MDEENPNTQRPHQRLPHANKDVCQVSAHLVAKVLPAEAKNWRTAAGHGRWRQPVLNDQEHRPRKKPHQYRAPHGAQTTRPRHEKQLYDRFCPRQSPPKNQNETQQKRQKSRNAPSNRRAENAFTRKRQESIVAGGGIKSSVGEIIQCSLGKNQVEGDVEA